jgi:hypothetical protein
MPCLYISICCGRNCPIRICCGRNCPTRICPGRNCPIRICCGRNCPTRICPGRNCQKKEMRHQDYQNPGSSIRGKTRFRPSSGHINPLSPNTLIGWDMNLRGSPDFMIISFGIPMRWTGYRLILETTFWIGSNEQPVGSC